MRPLYLKMTAFGAYSKTVEIDFTKFGDTGMFLICGDTGSGKTTIFDAIIYALYGEASGSLRDNKSFRSDYTKDSTPTNVVFTFECNKKTYQVDRTPSQSVYSARKNKYVDKAGTADLVLIGKDKNKTLATKDKETTKKVEEIIGINARQFKSVAMLAQGEFQKVITTENNDSNNRKIILRNIFGTQKYNDLQDYLKEEAKGLKEQYEQQMISIKQAIDEIEVFEDEYESDLREITKNKIPLIDESIKLLQSMLKDVDRELSKKEVDGVEIQKVYTNLSKDLELAKKNKDKANDLSIKKNNLDAVKNELIDYKKKETKHKSYKDKYNNSKKQFVIIKKEIETLNLINTDEKELRSLQVKSKFISGNLKIQEKSIDSLKISLNDYQRDFNKLSGIDKDLKEINKKYISVDKKVEIINSIVDDFDTFLENEKSKASNQIKLEKIENKYIKATNTYEEVNSAYINNQAGLLAKTLKEGKPCPVCGSKIHPAVCKVSTSKIHGYNIANINKSIIGNLKKEKENLDKERKGISELLAGLIKTNKTIEIKILKQIKNEKLDSAKSIKLTDTLYNKIVNKYNDLISVHENLGKMKDDYETKIDHRNDLSNKISNLRSRIDKDSISINNKKNELSAVNEKIKLLTTNIKRQTKKLSVNNLRSAKTELNRLKEFIKDYENDEKNITKKINDLNIEKSKLESAINELQKALKDVKSYDVKKLNNEFDKIKHKKSNNDDDIKNLASYKKDYGKKIEFIKKGSKKYDSLESEYQEFNELSQCLSGTYKGIKRIDLETFVLTFYFDKMLERANVRLMELSKGEFELVRRKDDSLQSKGLELDVIDHNTGKVRNVGSLSGGEQFMASISMALGLSDTIQSESRNFDIGTIFIDEGFGSLSDEYRKKSMNILKKSTEGKLVGIISHVEELKNEIDKKIVVKKDEVNGSSLKIVI